MDPETLLTWRDRLTVLAFLAGTLFAAYLVFRLSRELYLFAVGRKLHRRVTGILQVAMLSFGVVAVCVVLAVGMIMMIFAGPAPSDSPWARLGQQRAGSVLTALDSFRRETGQYPESLAALTPKHLSPGPRATGAFNRGHFGSWEYRRTGPTSFELTFDFPGPGKNYCQFVSTEGQWQCSGYF